MVRVLIVDDEPHIRELLLQSLEEIEGWGLELRTASDGLEALEAARSWRPRIVFMDITMPGMDGVEACRAIKADPALGDVYVVMVTAMDGTRDRDRGIAAGADLYLTKPFDPDDVLDIVEEILNK